MQIVLTLLILILFSLAGLVVWSSSERPLALREIAINTRRDGEVGPDYVFLKLLGVLLKVFAVIVWNAGLFLMFYVNLVGVPGIL